MIDLHPKDLFYDTPEAKVWREIVGSSAFRQAASVAMSEYFLRAPTSATQSEACDRYNRLLGAKEFLNLLINIAEPVQQPRRSGNDNLRPT